MRAQIVDRSNMYDCIEGFFFINISSTNKLHIFSSSFMPWTFIFIMSIMPEHMPGVISMFLIAFLKVFSHGKVIMELKSLWRYMQKRWCNTFLIWIPSYTSFFYRTLWAECWQNQLSWLARVCKVCLQFHYFLDFVILSLHLFSYALFVSFADQSTL